MGNTKETIVTMGGLRIVPDIEIDKLSMNDTVALILPGGNTWTDQSHNLVLSTVMQMVQIYGKNAEYTSIINVVITIVGIVTMPILVWLYQI